MQFFGEVDRNKHGKFSAEYPAWYFENHIDEMKESLERQRRALERGQVPPDQVPYTKAEIEKVAVRLRDVLESKPHLSDGERDKLNKHYKTLGNSIAESLFTRDAMRRGIADAHEEARRMVGCCVGLSGELLTIAKSMNIKVEKSKVSRNGATRMFKIIGRLLELPTNVEALRKDN